MALTSASESMAALDRSKGSGMRGVTGLRTSAGKSRMLGERMSAFRGGVGDVDGDVKERLGGVLDLGERGRGPDGGVLA